MIQRKYQLAKIICEKIWEEYLETTSKTKSRELMHERDKWLYVCYELNDLLKSFGVEVVA